MAKITWDKVSDGYNGYLNGHADADNPDYFITRVSGRMHLFVAGSDDKVKAGNLKQCQDYAEQLAEGAGAELGVPAVNPTGTEAKAVTADESAQLNRTYGPPAAEVPATDLTEGGPCPPSAPEFIAEQAAKVLANAAKLAGAVTLPTEADPSEDPEGGEDVPARTRETLDWPKDPASEDWGGNPAARWTSLCGRYRITRIYHRAMERTAYGCEAKAGEKFVTFENDEKLGAAYPKWHHTLRQAIEACERDLQAENGLPVDGNREAVLMAYSEPPAAGAPAKGKGKPAAAAGDVPETDGQAPKAAKQPKAPGAGKGPGVIDTIAQCLIDASEADPTTKDAILARLAELFPDRDADGMAKTVSIQLNRLKKERGLDVRKNDKGYWAPKSGK